MEKTKQIISDNKHKFSEFTYYLLHVEKIEKNVNANPDVAIETCNSLIAGVSKKILNMLGVSYVEKGRVSDSPNSLLKKALENLSSYTALDTSLVQPLCSFVHRVNEIRNERGDISHGRSSPKVMSSDAHISGLVSHETDGIVYYMLSVLFNSDISLYNPLKYEDNKEFNEFLDYGKENYGIIYSRALFDQDQISYNEQLKDYDASMKDDNLI